MGIITVLPTALHQGVKVVANIHNEGGEREQTAFSNDDAALLSSGSSLDPPPPHTPRMLSSFFTRGTQLLRMKKGERGEHIAPTKPPSVGKRLTERIQRTTSEARRFLLRRFLGTRQIVRCLQRELPPNQLERRLYRLWCPR